MNNVKVKSRMYTIVEPQNPDDILKNYNTKTIKIDGQKVKAWILDDEKCLCNELGRRYISIYI